MLLRPPFRETGRTGVYVAPSISWDAEGSVGGPRRGPVTGHLCIWGSSGSFPAEPQGSRRGGRNRAAGLGLAPGSTNPTPAHGCPCPEEARTTKAVRGSGALGSAESGRTVALGRAERGQAPGPPCPSPTQSGTVSRPHPHPPPFSNCHLNSGLRWPRRMCAPIRERVPVLWIAKVLEGPSHAKGRGRKRARARDRTLRAPRRRGGHCGPG